MKKLPILPPLADENIQQVNRTLLQQLDVIANRELSEQEFEIECRRSHVMNGIAGNIIKISALSLQAQIQQQRLLDMEREVINVQKV